MSRVPIPDDWDGSTYCCRIIQWPSSTQWTAILLGLITWPQRGRFWDERTGTVTDAQSIGQKIYSKNVLEGGCILGCIDDLQSTFERIATALEGLQNGSGTCCVPVTESLGEYPDPGPEIGPGGSPPPGYTSDEPDTSERCLLANWFYQQTLAVLQEIQNTNVLVLLAASVAISVSVLLDVLSLAASAIWLAMMNGQLGSLSNLVEVLLGSSSANLQNVIDAVSGDQEGLVCAMYNGDTNGDVGDNIENWADDQGLSGIERTLLRAVLNDYVLVGLFYARDGSLAEAAEVPDQVNCAVDCLPVDTCPLNVVNGSGTVVYDGSEFDIDSEDAGSYHFIQLSSDCLGGGCDEAGNWCVQVADYDFDDTTDQFSRTFQGYTSACALNTKEYQYQLPSGPPLDQTLKLATVVISNHSPFTITLKIVGRGGPLGVGEDPENYSGGCP